MQRSSKKKPLDYDSLDYDSFINADLIIEEWNRYPEADLEKWDKKQKQIRKNRKRKIIRNSIEAEKRHAFFMLKININKLAKK